MLKLNCGKGIALTFLTMEIERKILDINKREFIARLKKLKARKIFSALVRVKYFDFADGSIRAKKDLLRLREFCQKGKEPYTEFVYKIYKGVKGGCKYFEELESRFDGKAHFKTLSNFLLGIGLKHTLYYEKKRTLYSLGKIHFEIDEHPRMPAFVEIEAQSPQEINKTVKLLGLQKCEQTAETISELIKRKYPHLSLNGLRFR